MALACALTLLSWACGLTGPHDRLVGRAAAMPTGSVVAVQETPSQLVDQAMALIARNRLADARPLLLQARDMAVATGDVLAEGRAAWGLGRIAFLEADDSAADAHYATAAQRFEAVLAFELRAQLAMQRGRELVERGRFPAAEQQLRSAMAVVRADGPRWLEAQLLRNLTFVPTVPLAERLDLIVSAERLLVGQQRPALEGLVAHQHGDLAFLAGDYVTALRETERAVDLLQRSGTPADLARALTSVGRIHRVHGEPEEAIPWYQRALAVQRGFDSPTAAMQNLIGLGIANTLLARRDEAVAAFAEAVVLARRSPQAEDLVFALAQQAIGLVQCGRLADAERALAELVALPPAPRQQGGVDAARGWVAFAAGRHAEALVAFDAALATPGMAADGRVQLLEQRALALDALRRHAEAVAAATEAIGAIEHLRATLVPRDYFKRGFDRSWARLYALSVRRLADAGQAAQALDVAEHARARAFADLVASRLAERSPRLAPAGSAGDANARPAEVPGTRRDLAALGSAASVSTVAVEAMLALARTQQTTLVCYWVDDDVTRAWVIAPTGELHLERLPIGRRALEGAVASTMMATGGGTLAATPASRGAFRRLHAALVAPLSRSLPAHGGHITVVPHGPLFRLSFAALTDRRGRYLIEDHEISYAPSVTVLKLLLDRTPHAGAPAYLLVGDPAIPTTLASARGFVPLPGARREVETIRRRVAPATTTVLRRQEASEPAVRRAAPSASVVHMATHALADDARPFESFLALAAAGQAADTDGRLTAEEVYDLQLDADLVVLSACRSASGPVTGDGLLGLTRAFLSSGARSVMATVWDLPDEAARVMLPRFYREWLATGRASQALRRAQLAWLADLRAGRGVVDSPLGRVVLAEHPALWASLVLQGRP